MSPISTSRLLVDTERTRDLDDCLQRLSEGDHRYDYSAAWIDCLARGRSLGRSVLYRGNFATPDQLPAGARRDPLRYRPRQRLRVPVTVPVPVLNRASAAAFNELWYRRAPTHHVGEITEIASFFHPLDAVGDWNKLYGPRGFLQYQFVVPPGAEDVLRRVIGRLAHLGCASFLAVLKRFGPGNPGLLSFPREGWTLALDLPSRTRELGSVLDEIDELVVAAGGRIYLAKDSRLRPDLLGEMYPRLGEFRRVCAAVDPDGVLRSDMSRRLGL